MPSMILSSIALWPSVYGYDPGVTCLVLCGLALWYLGYPDQACKEATRALAWPGSWLTLIAWLWPCIAAAFHQLRREGQAAPRAGGDSDCALSTEQGFPSSGGDRDYPAGLGVGRAGTGRGRDCKIRQGLDCLPGHGGRASGARIGLPMLAEAYGKAGQVEEGLDCAGRGIGCGGQNRGAYATRRSCIGCKGELTLQSVPESKV